MFLFGCHLPNTTSEERLKQRDQKLIEYTDLSSQWRHISAEQEQHFRVFRDRKSRIQCDVLRTDRHLPFYQGDSNPHLHMLFTLLMNYSFFNFDLGYSQGMSDILSVILMVQQNELDTFMCFTSMMEVLKGNFEHEQVGMQLQLRRLESILNRVDPQFASHLKKIEGSDCFFCFRWILLRFKREFELNDIFRLWEVLWSCPYCLTPEEGERKSSSSFITNEYHLWMCAYILLLSRDKILNDNFRYDQLCLYVNSLSGRLDVFDVMMGTRSLYLFFHHHHDNNNFNITSATKQ
jgi:hypothetical protein